MTPRERYRQVARLHMRCLDQGFLATLGEGFLALMYEAIDRTEGATLLVAEDGGQVQGFITGGVGMRPIYSRMMRSPMRLGLALAPAMLRPAKVRRILEIVRYSGDGGLPEGLPDAELLSLAVAPEWRGKAVADGLYRRLVEDFRKRGVDAFRITVGEALAPAHRFYQRMGATVAGEVEVHGGETSKVYVHRV
ncbi:GNAT family N-acetyltransferase [Luteimonas arsenica]|uniref:GNAT family N-acetyltransferase n=1 Tax=Luteimonas arsenica TaxID=1586242 RepID=UPI001404C9C0|nr:GNAT family N-acetyltransferase [Luteimonas arsenica]